MERINKPTKRLRHCPINSKVYLKGVDRELTVKRLRDDGYYELNNAAGYLSVTASPGHEILESK